MKIFFGNRAEKKANTEGLTTLKDFLKFAKKLKPDSLHDKFSDSVSTRNAGREYKVAREALELFGKLKYLKDEERSSAENTLAAIVANYGYGKQKVRAFAISKHEVSQITLAESITGCGPFQTKVGQWATGPENISAALAMANSTTSTKALAILMENFVASGASAHEIAKMLDSLELPPHVKVATGFLKQALQVEDSSNELYKPKEGNDKMIVKTYHLVPTLDEK